MLGERWRSAEGIDGRRAMCNAGESASLRRATAMTVVVQSDHLEQGALSRLERGVCPLRRRCGSVGKFSYDGTVKTEIEDRALTHIQLVMTAKLRRGEPFPFSWLEDASVGGGRTTVWVQPGSSLVFKYYGSRQPAINRAWIEALAHTANQPSGLYLVPEPADE